MSNQLQLAGAQLSSPARFAPIFTNRFFQGLWTQRNPLRDAGSTRIEEKFYGTRGDAMIDGSNIEISNRLTPTRRPGLSVYNSQSFTNVDAFYAFRTFSQNTESIKVIVDTSASLYNGTGPSTKTLLHTKVAGAGQTYMQDVANVLYFGDGVDTKKWLQPTGWVANSSILTTNYAIGTLILDTGGVIEYLDTVLVGNITNVSIKSYTATFTFNNTNFGVTTGMSFTVSLATATFLNNLPLVALSVIPSGSTFLVTASVYQNGHPNYASAADTGTATTTDVGTPATTGGSQPAWGGLTTADGISTWAAFVGDATNGQVFNWGPPNGPAQAPTIAPTTQFGGDQGFWQPNTSVGTEFNVLDETGDVQVVIQGPNTTAASLPKFMVPDGSIVGRVADGSVSWQGHLWLGSTVGTSVITNTPVPWKASTPVTSTGVVGDLCLDSNGNLQFASNGSGSTGSSAPSWALTQGTTTTDSGITWNNLGPWLALTFEGWQYGYSFHCIDDSVSELSPLTVSTNGVLGGVQVSGNGSGDPQVDSIWIFRTTDGGATPLFLASVPNPGGGLTWTYADYNPDTNLNLFLIGPQGTNSPPPVGLINLTYHLGRIFGSVGNIVYWSGGPDTTTGNGNTVFPPLNSAAFPSLVTRIVATSVGALVFTRSDIYIISGLGTSNSPLFSVPYGPGIGLNSYNALAVNGSVVYLFTSDSQVVSLDPSSGLSQVGFPIGDQFVKNNWSPSTPYLAWHVSGSQDHALFVADGSTGWFRMSPTASPESGLTWSPFATIAGGCKAVDSLEVSPGVHRLLVGPTGTGQILQRDLSTTADNGTSYTAFFTIGSLVLCQPGQIAELSFIATDSPQIGSAPSISVLIDEVSGSFETMPLSTPDPPQLVASSTLYGLRFYFSQTQQPAVCRHLQIKVSWPSEQFANELYDMTLFGTFLQEN